MTSTDSKDEAVAAGQQKPSRLSLAAGFTSLAVLVVLMAVGLMQPDNDNPMEELALADVPDLAAARQEPTRLLEHILGRLYLAFGESDEGALYDSLAAVASGPLLDELYLQKRAALTQGPGTASSQQLNRLEILEVASNERDGGFDFDATWQVVGTVEHGDHAHIRGNAYSASLRVEPDGQAWRLVAFELLDTVRIDPVELDQVDGHEE